MGKSQFVNGLFFFLIESYVFCQDPTPILTSVSPTNDVCLVNYAGTVVARGQIDYSGTGPFWSRIIQFRASGSGICAFNATVCPSFSITGICYCEKMVDDIYYVVMNFTIYKVLAGTFVFVDATSYNGLAMKSSSGLPYPRLSDEVTEVLVIDGANITTNASCVKAGNLTYNVMGLDSPYTVTCNTTSTSSPVTLVSSVGRVALNLENSTSQFCCGYVEDGPTCKRSARTCYCIDVLVPPGCPDCKFATGSTFTLYFAMIVQMALGVTYLVFCICKDNPGCFSSHWYDVLMGVSCGMLVMTLVDMAVFGSQEMHDVCLSTCQYLFVLFFLLPTVTVTVYVVVLCAKGSLDIIFLSPFVLEAIVIFMCVFLVFAEKEYSGRRNDWHIAFLFFGCVIFFAVIVGIITTFTCRGKEP